MSETTYVDGKTLDELAAEDMDWNILADDRVQAIAEQAARKVASICNGVTTSEDEYQEAVIRLAANAPLVTEYLSDPLVGERKLYRWLYTDLLDKAKADVRRSKGQVTLTAVGQE